MTKTRSSWRISSAMASRKASLTVCVFVGPSQSASAMIWAGRGASTGAAGTGAAAAGASATATAAGAGASSKLSPSSTKWAITVPTATLSVPSATVIFAITPSSMASTSIVALSVSISAMTSPERTSSPSATNHLARRPSVIVGDKAGILISIAISNFLYITKVRLFRQEYQCKAHQQLAKEMSAQNQWHQSPLASRLYQSLSKRPHQYLHAPTDHATGRWDHAVYA